MNYPTKKSLWVFLTIFIAQYGSAVFGFDVNECEQDIFKKFDKDKSPRENFLYAFEIYNQLYFSNPTKNESAQGYFEDLFKSIEQTSTGANVITHPISYCDQYENAQDKITCEEALALLLSNEEGNTDAEILRVLEVPESEILKITNLVGDASFFLFCDPETKPDINLFGALEKTEIEILKYCYLNQSKLDLTVERVFPYQYFVTFEGNIPDPQNDYWPALERKTKGDIKQKAKIEIMHGYFDHLLNAAKTIADFAEFKDPLAYCKSILGDDNNSE